jgi:hypothetical protein
MYENIVRKKTCCILSGIGTMHKIIKEGIKKQLAQISKNEFYHHTTLSLSYSKNESLQQ